MCVFYVWFCIEGGIAFFNYVCLMMFWAKSVDRFVLFVHLRAMNKVFGGV